MMRKKYFGGNFKLQLANDFKFDFIYKINAKMLAQLLGRQANHFGAGVAVLISSLISD
jgi:hypothetical protein